MMEVEYQMVIVLYPLWSGTISVVAPQALRGAPPGRPCTEIVAINNKAVMQCIKLRASRQSKDKAIYITVDNITFVHIGVLSKELLTMTDL